MDIKEKWRDVEGYENIYEVSNFGNVRTCEGKITNSKLHGIRHWKQRVLKQKTDKKGYKRVSLWIDKKDTTMLVHRIVAMAFIPKIEGKNCINHIDGNPSNNCLENLEWCDHKDNLLHAFNMRLNQSPDPVILLNKKNNETRVFVSKVQASEFLGKDKGYVSRILKKGITSIGNFEVFTRQSKIES